jgi:hypothetical protein
MTVMEKADRQGLYEELVLYGVSKVTSQRQISIPKDAFDDFLGSIDRIMVFGAPTERHLILVPPPAGRAHIEALAKLTRRA